MRSKVAAAEGKEKKAAESRRPAPVNLIAAPRENPPQIPPPAIQHLNSHHHITHPTHRHNG